MISDGTLVLAHGFLWMQGIGGMDVEVVIIYKCIIEAPNVSNTHTINRRPSPLGTFTCLRKVEAWRFFHKNAIF